MTQNDQEKVRMSNQLWSDEVAIANAKAPLPPADPAYAFSNGRVFEEKPNPYAS